MPFTPSDAILEACDGLCEEVDRGRRESQSFRGSGHPGGHIHEQVTVQTPDGPAEVDRGIASLLQRLWDRGINTDMSCQDNMGSVWISFRLSDFMRLHRLARESDDLAYFVDSCYMRFSCFTPEHFAWEFADSDGEGEPPLFPPQYYVDLRFPRQLHGTFERLLDDAAAAEDASVAAMREERAARRRRVSGESTPPRPPPCAAEPGA